MKRVLNTIVVLLLSISALAQTLDDVGRLSINVQRPQNTSIPTEAMDMLVDKMHQIITTAGIGDNAFNPRFALSATVSVVKKDIIADSPSRISQTVEVAFYVRDVIDGKEYGNTTISSVGVGINENKAFVMAFSNIKAGNPRLQQMIQSSKELIVAYYRTNIDHIIAKAYTLTKQGDYDNALYMIAQVPNVCAECTDKCQKATIDIYQQKIDARSEELLQQAQAAWNTQPDAEGAVKAAQFLSQINILAVCQPQATTLMEEMKAKVLDDERKAWEFEMQQYADAQAREQRDFEFRVRKYEEREAKEQARYEEDLAREQRNYELEKYKYDNDHARDMAIIEASRQVALEYAQNKQNQ